MSVLLLDEMLDLEGYPMISKVKGRKRREREGDEEPLDATKRISDLLRLGSLPPTPIYSGKR